jgi:hypothetical protein
MSELLKTEVVGSEPEIKAVPAVASTVDPPPPAYNLVNGNVLSGVLAGVSNTSAVGSYTIMQGTLAAWARLSLGSRKGMSLAKRIHRFVESAPGATRQCCVPKWIAHLPQSVSTCRESIND